MSDPGKSQTVVIPFPGRTIERGRGCYNCKHFDTGERARNHYASRRAEAVRANPGLLVQSTSPLPGDHVTASRMAGALGISADQALERILASRAVAAEDARFVKFDAMLREGRLGICEAGKSAGDFTENMYLCDHWSGVTGSSLATAGHKLDKLPEELREELDGPAPKPTPDDDGGNAA